MKTKLKEFIEFRFLIISANKLFVCETGSLSWSHEGRPTRLFSKCRLPETNFPVQQQQQTAFSLVIQNNNFTIFIKVGWQPVIFVQYTQIFVVFFL